jgi:hypothetical protein
MSTKISNLPAASSVNDADLIPIVQDGVTKKAATSLIRPALTTTGVVALTEAIPLGSTYTLDATTSTAFFLTLASGTPCTFTMPTASANKPFSVYLKQPSSGTPTTAVFTGVNWINSIAPTVTATLGKMDVFSFFSDGTKWFGNYIQNFTY